MQYLGCTYAKGYIHMKLKFRFGLAFCILSWMGWGLVWFLVLSGPREIVAPAIVVVFGSF